MTTRKAGGAIAAAPDQVTPEQPAAGGSYVRQPDGTLQRVASTAMEAPPGDTTPPVATGDTVEDA